MSRPQKIFISILIAFFIGLLALAIDISRKTSFPGSKKRLKQGFKQELAPSKPTAQNGLSVKSATYQP